MSAPRPFSKKNPTAAVSVPIPTFRSRRTLAEHVKDNMICAGKQSYHQRLIFVASHKTGTPENSLELKRTLKQFEKFSNNLVADTEILTGLIIIYTSYSVYMLEGSEKCIGKFSQKLTNDFEKFFKCARVVLIFNNINQVILKL